MRLIIAFAQDANIPLDSFDAELLCRHIARSTRDALATDIPPPRKAA
jgi:hypothetical protein